VKLVGGIPTPLKNMSSSVGMMTFPTDGKIKKKQTTNQEGSIWAILPSGKRLHNYGKSPCYLAG